MRKKVFFGIMSVVTSLTCIGACGQRIEQIQTNDHETGRTAGVFTTLAGFAEPRVELTTINVNETEATDKVTAVRIVDMEAEDTETKEETGYASDILLVKSQADEEALEDEIKSLESVVDGKFVINKKESEDGVYYVHINHEIGTEAMYSLVNTIDKLDTVEEACFCVTKG